MGAKRKLEDQGQIHSVELACYHAVHEYTGGVGAVAAVFGWSSALLQNKLNPTQTGHKLNAKELEAILELTKDERILAALGAAAGAVFIPMPEPDLAVGDLDLLECGSGVHGGAFGFVNEMVVALEDGEVDPLEKLKIEKKLQQLMGFCHQMLELTKQYAAK